MFEEYVIRILLAALVGGLVGIEREFRDKSAGFRTMILIGVGSALFTILADVIGAPFEDSARIASSVVSGVGFLGAGVIIKDGSKIRGLTTAASIWLVASLGMGMGAGEIELALAVTAIILTVLWVLPPIERRIDSLHEFLEFSLTIKNDDAHEAEILGLLADSGVKVVHIDRARDNKSERRLTLNAKTNPKDHEKASKLLINHPKILKINL